MNKYSFQINHWRYNMQSIDMEFTSCADAIKFAKEILFTLSGRHTNIAVFKYDILIGFIAWDKEDIVFNRN